MEGSRERSDAEQEDRLVRAGRSNVVEEALSVSLPPYLILSDTVLSLWCQLARRFLSECLSPSRRRWPRPSCDRPYTSRRLEDLLCRLVCASGSLSSLWAAIADDSHPDLFCNSPAPLLRTPLPSVPIRTQTGHSRPSQFAPWGNILSPGAPDTPPQRICRPGTHVDGSTESLRHPFSQSSSSPMLCCNCTM